MSESTLTERGREMLALAREYEAVGGDPREFARRAGVKPQTFTWWRSRLRAHLDRSSGRFLEVIVDEPHAPAPLRLAVGGVVVELPSGFDQGELARVLEVLRRC